MENGDVIFGVVANLSEVPDNLGLVVGVSDVVALQDKSGTHDTLLTSAVLDR